MNNSFQYFYVFFYATLCIQVPAPGETRFSLCFQQTGISQKHELETMHFPAQHFPN